jgi:hypothetical protein
VYFCTNFATYFYAYFCTYYYSYFCDGESATKSGEFGLGDGRIAAEPAIDGIEYGGMGFVLEGGAETGEMGGEGLGGNAKLVGMLETVGVHEHAMVAIRDGIAPFEGDVLVKDAAAAGDATGHGEAAA